MSASSLRMTGMGVTAHMRLHQNPLTSVREFWQDFKNLNSHMGKLHVWEFLIK
jgi:hypothetical protein